LKEWWKSKSIWLGVLIVLGGIGEYLSGVPEGASVSTMIAGVLSIIVRYFTNQSIK
jgi:hypothetical protein